MSPKQAKAPTPPQEEALMHAYPDIGEVAVRNLEPMTEAGRVVARGTLQLEVLTLFGKINQKAYIIGRQETLNRYRTGAPIVLERAKELQKTMRQQAEDKFFESIEYHQGRAQLEAEGQPKRVIKDFDLEAKRAWNRFKLDYHQPDKKGPRANKAKQLRREIKLAQSGDNRSHQFRPHMLDEFRKRLELPKLSTRERMEAIQEDPRARFMPTTHREKNVVMSWLDYLDNPEYPLGTTNQLLEVYNHQARLPEKGQYGKELPGRTVRSIVYEIHDYGVNAAQSLSQLWGLEAIVDNCFNPNISLAEEAPNHPGLAVLVRYRDIKRFVDKNTRPSHGVDLMVTKEDRRPHRDDQKNKTVEDIYTRLEIDDNDIASYVAEVAASPAMHIKHVRSLLQSAITDQEARLAFWRDRFSELADSPDSRNHQIRRLAGRLLVEPAILPAGAGAV